jgi:glucokinase
MESRRVSEFAGLVDRYVQARGEPIEAACFGVAGPVVGDRVAVTNLSWDVDGRALGALLRGVPVLLLNDLEALAYGAGLLPDDRLAVVNPGRARAGNRAVIAAGTGLGEAGLAWDGRRHRPFASEGGHADFAPRSERELALLRFLARRHGHVSWERVVSGPGLVSCFEFLRDDEGMPVPPALATAVAAGDPAAAISAAALAGTTPIASAALDLFVDSYGAEAGNLALKLMATGGVYVGGGIAPKILPRLLAGGFRRAFVAKGRFEGLLADVPVRVVLDPRTALYGTAHHAAGTLAAR